ncbi:MAG TPA: hypothetical protein VD997_06990 [Phycisphaerales bacterium]|nr:hypothetical protein [Phycisphaerales bacterium]
MQDELPDLAQGHAPRTSEPAPPADDTALGDDLFTTLTPGFIISTLRPARAREVADQFREALHQLSDEPRTLARSSNDSTAATRALLRLLTDEELRRIALKVGLPTDGHYLSLYHRLALLC